MKKRAKLVRSPLDKKQILDGMKRNVELQKRLKFIKEQFWPLLCETSDSIEDASTFLGGFNTALMQSFLGLMKEKKFSELEMDKKIAGDYEKYKKILVLFNDMNVFEAKDLIEGMKSEIALFQQDEARTRKLDSLPTRWIDQL